MEEEQIKAILREQNEEFRRLEEKHHKYEEELDVIANLVFPSSEQRRAAKELKKRKLQVKDKLHRLIQAYQKEA